jgi:DNA-binding MarR family transcriptional regulator
MDNPDPARVLDDLPGAAAAFSRAIDLIRKDLFQAAGVSLTELRTLSRVAEAPGINPSALSTELALGGAAVTAITDGLVGRGLLDRVGDPRDRRRVILRLTPEGEQLVDATYSRFSAVVIGASGGLSEESLATITHDIQRLAAGLEQAHRDLTSTATG